MGYFHTTKVFDAYSVPNILSNEAPKPDTCTTPIARGVGVNSSDLHVFPRSRFGFFHARTDHGPYAVRKSHCHVFLGGLDPGQAPLKTLLLMLRQT